MWFKLLRRSIRVVSLSLFEHDCRPDEFTEGVRASLSGIRPLCSPLQSKHLDITRAAKLAIKTAHMKKRHGLSEYASSHPEKKTGRASGRGEVGWSSLPRWDLWSHHLSPVSAGGLHLSQKTLTNFLEVIITYLKCGKCANNLQHLD